MKDILPGTIYKLGVHPVEITAVNGDIVNYVNGPTGIIGKAVSIAHLEPVELTDRILVDWFGSKRMTNTANHHQAFQLQGQYPTSIWLNKDGKWRYFYNARGVIINTPKYIQDLQALLFGLGLNHRVEHEKLKVITL